MKKFVLALLCFLGNGVAIGETRLPPEYKAHYKSVLACLGANVKAPRIEFDKTIACPTSGLQRCMKHYPFFQCGSIACGANGVYYPSTNTIWLADKYTISMKHESVHQILFQLGDPSWWNHANPAFAKCGRP